MISTINFWTGLLAGVGVAFVVNLVCLVVLIRVRGLEPPDAAVVNMLKRIAIFNAVPLLWFITYFIARIVAHGDDSVRSIWLVAYASGGYLLALIGLVLPALCAAVLTYHRSRRSPHGD